MCKIDASRPTVGCSPIKRLSLRTAIFKHRRRLDVPLNFRLVRHWRGIDIDAFTADLVQSTLVVTPPYDVVAAFEGFNATLSTLLNKYAPPKLKRPSERWHDMSVESPNGKLAHSK